LEELEQKGKALGATGLVGLQIVQSQFQWNQRTSLLATAIRNSHAERDAPPASDTPGSVGTEV
jgi:hypothetical protein